MERYNAFMNAFTKANPEMKSRQFQLQEGQKMWNELKNYPEKLNEKMLELKTKASKSQTNLLQMWAGLGNKASKRSIEETPRPSDAFPATSNENLEIASKVSLSILE